jgi:exopolysaccharide biosynthesis polyprenyl glycosylphosphotransferase
MWLRVSRKPCYDRNRSADGSQHRTGSSEMNGTAARPAHSTVARDFAAAKEFSGGFVASEEISARGSSGRLRVGLVRQIIYVAIDVAMVWLGGLLVFWLSFDFHIERGLSVAPAGKFVAHVLSPVYPGFLALYAALIVLACKSQHLYRTPKEVSAIGESTTVLKAVGLATALFVMFVFASGNKEISRVSVAYAGVLNACTLAGWRYAKRWYVLRRVNRGECSSRVLIVGAGPTGRALAAWLEANRQLGYSVCGFVDPHRNGEARVLGALNDFRRVALEQFVDQVFVALPADREVVKEIFVEARRLRLDMNVVPDLYDGLGWHAPMHAIGGFPVLELHGQPIPAFGLAAKRVLDVLLGIVGFGLSLPIVGLAALWIVVDSPGPVFYSALRIGRKGKKFRCYKLRTMVAGAHLAKEELRQSNERNGPFFKMEKDPRITQSGVWLRRFSVDELPQFINVIRGDMSLVGPRPHPLDDVELYRAEDLRRLDVKPGVTGLWQVTARRDPSFETNMALDLEYIERWSLALDFKILLKTLPVVLRAEGH